jgi:hypothetical protein
MKMNMEYWWNNSDGGKIKVLGEKKNTFPSGTQSTTNLIWFYHGVYTSIYIRYEDSVRTSQKTLRLCYKGCIEKLCAFVATRETHKYTVWATYE